MKNISYDESITPVFKEETEEFEFTANGDRGDNLLADLPDVIVSVFRNPNHLSAQEWLLSDGSTLYQQKQQADAEPIKVGELLIRQLPHLAVRAGSE